MKNLKTLKINLLNNLKSNTSISNFLNTARNTLNYNFSKIQNDETKDSKGNLKIDFDIKKILESDTIQDSIKLVKDNNEKMSESLRNSSKTLASFNKFLLNRDKNQRYLIAFLSKSFLLAAFLPMNAILMSSGMLELGSSAVLYSKILFLNLSLAYGTVLGSKFIFYENFIIKKEEYVKKPIEGYQLVALGFSSSCISILIPNPIIFCFTSFILTKCLIVMNNLAIKQYKIDVEQMFKDNKENYDFKSNEEVSESIKSILKMENLLAYLYFIIIASLSLIYYRSLNRRLKKGYYLNEANKLFNEDDTTFKDGYENILKNFASRDLEICEFETKIIAN